MICIVDYGLGNLSSIKNMLKKVGAQSTISADPGEIRAATGLILPGVGAFDAGMETLHASGVVPVLEERVFGANIPVLGICLGMQLLAKSSEEGNRPGLGWIDAHAKRFDFADRDVQLPVPHMGWSEVTAGKPDPLIRDMAPDTRFYFVHSYQVECTDPQDVLLSATYGYSFTAAFARGPVRGVQFHPEKSHKFGMALLHNFAQLTQAGAPVAAQAP